MLGCFLNLNKMKTKIISNHMSQWSFWCWNFWIFWCWNLVPFLPDRGFQLLKSLWLSLTYFLFNDAPNVLYRWKIWTVGRPIQHLDSSTMNECCCYSCSMWFCTEIHKALPEIEVIWRGAYVALNLYIPFSIPNAFQNMQAAYTVCTYAISMTESLVMQYCLRARRPRASNKGLQPCPLRTEISPVSLNRLMMLCNIDDEFVSSRLVSWDKCLVTPLVYIIIYIL